MILPVHPDNLMKASQIIRKGGLVAFPTETVYGLGADAFNAEAVARIFEAKQRPSFDPLIVHIRNDFDIEKVAIIKGREKWLSALAQFWPGGLTLVLPKQAKVPGIVTSGLDSVAVRVPADETARELIRLCETPIAAPSANRFGALSPTTAAHVEAGLGDAVELILDGGPSLIGVESTVLDLCGARPRLLRPGAVGLEAIEGAFEELELEVEVAKQGSPVRAPGQLESHYAPATPLRILGSPLDDDVSRCGVVAFKDGARYKHYAAVEVLSPKGDLREAAANLFAALHRLDKEQLAAIHAEPFPPVGLGLAIMDRLKRASAK